MFCNNTDDHGKAFVDNLEFALKFGVLQYKLSN